MSEAKNEIDNPWRTFIENVISGDNYFRSSEYRDLLEDLDRLYATNADLVRTLDTVAGALDALGDLNNLVRLARAATTKAKAA